MSPQKLVPGEGFEPPTFGLQNRCTTTVLTRHDRGLAGALRGTWDTGQAPPMRVFSARSTSLS